MIHSRLCRRSSALCWFLLCCASLVCRCGALSGHYYRIDVMLTELHNPKSLIHNGKRCDVFTACDPLLYVYIDTQKPRETFPGGARSQEDFTVLTSQYNSDTLTINRSLSKTICGSSSQALPTDVTARVDARDHDYFTGHDIMEEFNCSFVFRASWEGDYAWSEERPCKARFHPLDISLRFKWRVIPITPEQCGQETVPA
ncbi:uncharacterized protein LOC129582312 [Paramacrobiotus metropolitanus]|uniref:uncharacterized protein LOC129582312 n=1 Tax=Paramacrobiotus metropolitanus TaxID=2943436 RepID=UPI002445A0CC|nr:uncharacterized protein LOC129582312 [Paramacrobiotus metropolitanus]